MKWLLTAALLLIAGCAQTPIEVRESGTRFDYTSAQPPAPTARCIARNAEALSGSFSASERQGAAPDTWDVTVRVVSDAGGTYAVSNVTPEGTGSRAAIWITSRQLGSGENAARALMKGC